MSLLDDIQALVTVEPAFVGYAPTGQPVPSVVIRGLFTGDEGRFVDGSAAGWDNQVSLYCVAGSAGASYNLALMVMRQLDNARVGSSTLSTSMGYNGAVVEGAYESQVTAQLTQGEL